MDSPDGDDDLPAFAETAQRLKLLIPQALASDSLSSETIDRLVKILGDAVEAVENLQTYGAPDEMPRLGAFLQASASLDALIDPHAAEDAERRAESSRYLHRIFHEPHWPITLGAAALLMDLRPRAPRRISPELRIAVEAVLAQLDAMTLLMGTLDERAEREFADREVDWERAIAARRRLAPKFRTLADRFRQVAKGGGEEDSFEAASEEGVRLCRQSVEIGFFEILPANRSDELARDTSMSRQWSVAISSLYAMHPERFPSRSQRATFLGIREQDRTVLSMDYAAACEEIAEMVDSEGTEAGTKRAGQMAKTRSFTESSTNSGLHALERALEELQEGLQEPRRLWERLLRFVDQAEVDHVVRRFAKEFAHDPSRHAELRRRARYLTESTADGSLFAKDLDAVCATLQRAATGRENRSPDEIALLAQCRQRVDAIREKLPLFLGAGVRDAIGTLEGFGRLGSMPSDVRVELLKLATRAQDLDDRAERDACDGCYVLRAALYAATPEGAVDPHALKPSDFGGGALDLILAAADSLMAWARTAAMSEASSELPLSPIVHPAPAAPRKSLTIDDQMLLLIKNDPSARGWTAKKFADALVCSAGTVKETQTWKELMSRRRDERTARTVDRRRRRSTVEGNGWEEEGFD